MTGRPRLTDLQDAARRWLAANGSDQVSHEERYDFELDMQLSNADADSLIAFVKILSQYELSEMAAANLGAGLMESFVVKHRSSISDLDEMVALSPALRNAASKMWTREDMSADAIGFVKKYAGALDS